MGNRQAREKVTPSVDDNGRVKAEHEHHGQAVFPNEMLCEPLPIKCHTRGTTQTTGVALFSETDRPHSPAPPTRVRRAPLHQHRAPALQRCAAQSLELGPSPTGRPQDTHSSASLLTRLPLRDGAKGKRKDSIESRSYVRPGGVPARPGHRVTHRDSDGPGGLGLHSSRSTSSTCYARSALPGTFHGT